MTLVGKIFIVAILIMSVIYMGFAMAVYSAHTNWRDVVERTRDETGPGAPLGLKFQLEDLKAEKEEYQLKWEAATKERDSLEAAYRQQLGKLETERKELLAQRASLEQERDDLVKQNRELSANVDTATQDLRRLNQEVVGLREEIVKTQQERDAIFKEVVDKTDLLHDNHRKLVVAKEREAQLTKQVAEYTRMLKANDIDPKVASTDVTPNIVGLVTAVSKDDLIEISIGTDDGVRVGQTLVVFRGGTYLGRVDVQKTAPDRAVARVLKQYLRGEIQKGDRVATNLKLG